MRFTSWLSSLRRNRRLARRRIDSSHPHRTRLPARAESLEDRTLLSVSAVLVDSTLYVVSDADDDIAVGANAVGEVEVTVNGVVDGTAGPFAAADVQALIVRGGDLDNQLDLSQVFASDFSWADVDGNPLTIEVHGGNGDDTMTAASDLATSLFGGDGDDQISVLGGASLVDAGDGEDTIDGGSGNDTLHGGDGNDLISGGPSDDVVDGGDGLDTIDGELGNDTLIGGDGEDTIDGSGGDDLINASSGNDHVRGGADDDLIFGGAGHDLLYGDQDIPGGNVGDDTILGQGGDDTLLGSGGTDSLNGNAGADYLESFFQVVASADPPPIASVDPGTAAPNPNLPPVAVDDTGETIRDGRAVIDIFSNDFDPDGRVDLRTVTLTSLPSFATAFYLNDGRVLYTPQPGFTGVETITYTVEDFHGAVSNEATLTVTTVAPDVLGDTLSGGSGNDTIFGDAGPDTALGGSGNDFINGELGDDRLRGHANHDTLCGGGGADYLDGATGDDLLLSLCTDPDDLIGPELFVTDATAVEGEAVDVVLVIDVSGSTSSGFGGSPVGDVNNDGSADDILDAQLAAFIALKDDFIVNNVDARMGIVVFAQSAAQVDMDLAQAGVQLGTTPDADTDGDGVSDVENVLRSIDRGFQGTGVLTNYEDALVNTLNTFTSFATPPGGGTMVFLSDGTTTAGGAFDDDAQALRAMGIDLRAFGVGTGATLAELTIIDPNAQIITTTDDLTQALTGLGISSDSELIFTVSLSKLSFNPISVDFTTVDGTAVGGSDYIAQSGTLIFNPGTLSATVSIDMLNDGLTEGDEFLFLELSNPINATINDGTGVGVIQDDESGATSSLPSGFLTPSTRVVDVDSIIENATRATEEDYVAGQLLVRFHPGHTDAVEEAAVRALGGTILERFLMIDAALVALDEPSDHILDDIHLFLGDSLVMYAEPNYRLHKLATPDDTSFSTLWGMDNNGQTGGTVDADIDAVEAWDTFTGTDASIVCVIDTGIDYTHPDLVDNIWTNPGEIAGNGIDDDGNGRVDDTVGYDFSDDDADIMDSDGHGSHVAGTVGATGNNAEGVVGVNWDVSLMGAKIFPFATTATVAGAVNYVASMRQIHGFNITAINASYGSYFFTQTEYDSILSVNNAGVVFVAAAANDALDNDSTPAYPASYDLPGIISVAATDDRDQLSSFSNYGATSVDLGAPGGDQNSGRPGINSTVPTSVSASGYSEFQGTSMASPHVAGAVGLIRGLNPSLTVQEAKDAILSTVDQVTSLQGQVLTGGRLNLAAAVAAVAPPPPTPPTGPAVVDQVDLGDTMLGRSGRDTLIGAGGDDLMIAGGDRDTLTGGGGNDHQLAGPGDDLLNGNDGDDTLDGQGGADNVFGDAGDDTLVWRHGAGSDNLEGGDDYDVVHVRDGDASSVFGVQENQQDLTFQTDARLQLTDQVHTTNVGFSISEVIFQPGDGADEVFVSDLVHVPSLLVRVSGGQGDDVLSADGSDPGVVRLIFDGEGGDDTITGSIVNDTIRGGDGDDVVLGSPGQDTVHGEDGDDDLAGGDGDDQISGGPGFDTLNGDAGNDTLSGNDDRDLLIGGHDDDHLDGGRGRDTLNGKAGDDSLFGGEGTDRMYGGIGNDTLDGGRDNDSIYGNSGDDQLIGDHGNDSMKGGRGDDTLVGGDGNDQMFGDRGDDQLGGGDGNDTLNGARGDDILLGGDGNDTLLAGSGADIALGNLGDDYVKGQGGTRDTIAGGEGADLVFGLVSEIDEAFNIGSTLLNDLDAV